MRSFSVTVALCFVLLVSSRSTFAAADKPTANRPNVLFIAVDDLNHWVGYLGRNPQTKTPNIDKLAARGVRFTRSYCAAPVCNPSRAALMSGLRPSASGVYENNDDWRRVIPADLTLPTTFRRAGYQAFGAGKIYHGGFDRKTDFDDYLQREGGGAESKADGGVGGIRFAPLDCDDSDMADYKITSYGIEQLQKKHDKPFFIAVGLHKPHMPWNVPQKYYDLHPLDKIELPPYREDDLADIPTGGQRMAKPESDHAAILKSGRWKDAIQGYLAAISFCDAQIGRLLDALDKSPQRDNTIVVFWCDHGWHLGEKSHWRKFALWEEATRAPLVWVVPGVTKPNAVCDRTVDFMSIYPTLCDLCGIATPKHVQGPSIRKLLADPKAAWDQPAMTTYRFNNHAVRSEGWRFIRYADGGEELYDETKDPFEWTNLATDPKYAATKNELARWMPTENKPDVGRGDEPAETKKGKKKQKGAK
jgi:arylsulfatase A-like enzyme